MSVTINGSNTPTAGGVTYGDGTTYATTTAGTSGQLLQSNGASAPSWVAAPTTSPAGSNTQIQYNNSGAFGASSAFTFDGTTATTPRLALGGTTLPAAGTATLFSRSSDNNTYLQSGSGNTILLLDGSQNSMASFGSSTVQLLTGNTERFRIASAGQLGIGGANYGTSGQVLTSGGSGAAPTWSTPSSGAMVYITSVTASGAGAIDLSSGFSSTYDQYVLVGQNFSMSTTTNMYLRFYIGGSLITSANYGSNVGRLSGGGWSETLGGSSGQNQGYVLGTGTTYSATGNFNFVGYVNQPANTSIYKQFYWSGSFTNSSGLAFPYWGSTGINDTGAFTGIYFYPGSGTISGTLRLYGIKNS